MKTWAGVRNRSTSAVCLTQGVLWGEMIIRISKELGRGGEEVTFRLSLAGRETVDCVVSVLKNLYIEILTFRVIVLGGGAFG